MSIGAVVLAAGAGARLGGRPKALLELGGVPLILRQLVALSGAGVDEVVVVTGHHAEVIEAAVRAFPITLAHNPSPDDGQPTSVRIGLQALSPKLDAVIVALADQPMIGEQDITALIGAFKKRGDASMVVPRVLSEDGERLPGNPVIFDAAVREEWLTGSADLACRKWRLAHPERVSWFDTDNRRYRIDIDTPEDLERFEASTGHRLQWPAGLVREAVG
jgi:molybdenum cofactor cytidylyltransferase